MNANRSPRAADSVLVAVAYFELLSLKEFLWVVPPVPNPIAEF
jgi:hypothetical protein